MAPIKRFLTAEIPLWAAMAALFIVGAVASASFVKDYSDTVNSYFAAVSGADRSREELVFGPEPMLANEDFFQNVRASFISEKASFVEADLSAMRLRVYKGGIVAKEVPILAKGREGSWWETPAGLYKIELKAKNHFSSFGKVYQPWSMAFQGNFFIHGWPYYPDGTPVASTFSGGCIRLSNEDAEAVFGLVDRDMPVLVYEKDFERDEFSYDIKRPGISATHFLAADLRNSFVFIENDSKERVPMGSLTQLVTALISAEYVNLDKEVVYKGMPVTAVNVLYPLMLESDEAAAQEFVDLLGESWITKLMNDKAKALGMRNTAIASPTSDPGNTTTAVDLFSLAEYIHNNRSFIWKISTGTLNWSVYGEPVFKGLENKNKIDGLPVEFLGGKLSAADEGVEAAGESYVGVFNLTIRGEKRPIAIIVSGSANARQDVKLIADYILTTYK